MQRLCVALISLVALSGCLSTDGPLENEPGEIDEAQGEPNAPPTRTSENSTELSPAQTVENGIYSRPARINLNDILLVEGYFPVDRAAAAAFLPEGHDPVGYPGAAHVIAGISAPGPYAEFNLWTIRYRNMTIDEVEYGPGVWMFEGLLTDVPDAVGGPSNLNVAVLRSHVTEPALAQALDSWALGTVHLAGETLTADLDSYRCCLGGNDQTVAYLAETALSGPVLLDMAVATSGPRTAARLVEAEHRLLGYQGAAFTGGARLVAGEHLAFNAAGAIIESQTGLIMEPVASQGTGYIGMGQSGALLQSPGFSYDWTIEFLPELAAQ